MENGTVIIRLVHPTNNSDVEIEAPVNMLLKDIFAELIDFGFLPSEHRYEGYLGPSGLRKENINLDNDKTVEENEISNNDVIAICISY